MSKISKYPAVYSRILLGTPIDGRGLEVSLPDEATAQQERLRFWNFVKFLKRNPAEATHFGNRHWTISCHREGSKLIFKMRTSKSAQSLSAALDQALESQNITLPELPVEFPLDNIEGEAALAIEPEPFTPVDPMATFNKHFNKE